MAPFDAYLLSKTLAQKVSSHWQFFPKALQTFWLCAFAKLERKRETGLCKEQWLDLTTLNQHHVTVYQTRHLNHLKQFQKYFDFFKHDTRVLIKNNFNSWPLIFFVVYFSQKLMNFINASGKVSPQNIVKKVNWIGYALILSQVCQMKPYYPKVYVATNRSPKENNLVYCKFKSWWWPYFYIPLCICKVP